MMIPKVICRYIQEYFCIRKGRYRLDYIKEYNKLRITDDFMFAKVMRNQKLCKKLLEVILNIEIDKIEYCEEQKTIDITKDAKSIRLDVYVRDGRDTIYNVEMQTVDTKNLPKRSRYYQGLIDLNLIEKGEVYNKLNKSYVIFICMSDVFKKGRHIYTFENICIEDNTIFLKDETTKVFLNPYSDMDDVDEELGNFLKYLADGLAVDKFTQELDDEVEKAKENKEWRREFVTQYMKEQIIREEAMETGMEKGMEKATYATLYSLLQKNIITIAQAAEQANVSEEEFLAVVESMNKN